MRRRPVDLCQCFQPDSDKQNARASLSLLESVSPGRDLHIQSLLIFSLTARLCLLALQVEERHPTGPCFNFRAVKKGLVSERELSLSLSLQPARPLRVKARPPDSATPRLFLGSLGIITIEKNAITPTKLALRHSCTDSRYNTTLARRPASAWPPELVCFDKVNSSAAVFLSKSRRLFPS